MSIVQRQIRDAVEAALVATLPGTVHVLRAPRSQVGRINLPGVAFFGHGDRPYESDADTQREHRRIYTVRVEARVEAKPEDDATDDLARLVRKALLTESFPVQDVLQITWNEQQWDGADDGEDPMSGTALDFDFHYLFDPEAEAED